MTKLRTADLFCGAGGATHGLYNLSAEAGFDLEHVAVNHWDVAIASHSANHPGARHVCADIAGVVPAEVVTGGRLDLLWASPSCTHHSRARGGRPCANQLRDQPSTILPWLDQLYVKRLIVENVPEFVDWGPLGADGKPLKSQRGVLFSDWIASLKARGYRVEYRILNCADHGDATSRQRFFLQGVRGPGRIRWPEPTHARPGADGGLFAGATQPWRPARGVIDWSLPGKSIFNRPRPLASNTLARIAAGVGKFWGPWSEPFLRILDGARGNDAGLKRLVRKALDATPPKAFISSMNNWPGQREGRSVGLPIPTQTTGNHSALVQPYIIPQHSGGRPRGVYKPCSTFAAAGASALVQPLVMSAGGPECAAVPVDQPLGTVLTRDHRALAAPFVMGITQTGGGSRVRPVTDPMATACTKAEQALATPFAVVLHGTKQRDIAATARSLDGPLPTHATSGHLGVATPTFLLDFFNQNGDARGLDNPLGTQTTHDRFGTVYGAVAVDLDGMVVWLDILFRMLTPRELANAHSFPANYILMGNQSEQVKQVGNSVPVATATALCRAALTA